MSRLTSLDDLRALIADLPKGDDAASAAIDKKQSRLTKPQGSLGRLEELVAWLGRWQGSAEPKLDRVDVVVFAGNHGVVAQGVSAYPATVTAQMVANFERGGAAINQLCKASGAKLKVLALKLDQPTTDFTVDPAMSEREFVETVSLGFAALPQEADLVCLGEMGIGNTTVASALAAALFGGNGERWAGRGTGVDDAGLMRKSAAIDAGLKRHHYALSDPLQAARRLGGREFAAILGAVLAARQHNVPVLLDGFAATAAAAPLARLASRRSRPYQNRALFGGSWASGSLPATRQEADPRSRYAARRSDWCGAGGPGAKSGARLLLRHGHVRGGECR